MDTPEYFLAIFHKGNYSCALLFNALHTSIVVQGSFLLTGRLSFKGNGYTQGSDSV